MEFVLPGSGGFYFTGRGSFLSYETGIIKRENSSVVEGTRRVYGRENQEPATEADRHFKGALHPNGTSESW